MATSRVNLITMWGIESGFDPHSGNQIPPPRLSTMRTMAPTLRRTDGRVNAIYFGQVYGVGIGPSS